MTLRARARALVRNNPHAATAVRLFQDNVAGPLGMTLQAQVTFRNGTLRRPLNDAIEDAWQDFSEPDEFSVDGRLSCAEFQRAAIANWLVDGEILIRRKHAFTGNRHRYAVQLLDPDQLDETLTRRASETANEIRYGVEVDGDQRPVAYHLWDRHPSETGGRVRVRVVVRDLLHVYTQQRPGQVRGVTAFAPVLVRLHMLDGFEEAALVAARAAAASPIMFEQDPETYAAPDGGAVQEDVEIELEPGVSRLLPPGIKANMLSPEHPTTTFAEFDKAMLRAVASGLGVSYASLTQDLTDVNYSSIRAGLLSERDVWRGLQEWFATHVMTPIYRDWLQYANMATTVRLPTADTRQWWAASWEGRGWGWVDPLNDVQAAELEINLGLNTRTALARERGRDFETMAKQLHQEDDIAEEQDIEIDGVAKLRATASNQGRTNGTNAGTTGPGAGDAASGPAAADAHDGGAAGDAGDGGRGVRLVRHLG
jgi:lambda family phage portal protein